METAHWPQGIGVVRASMEGSKQPIINTNASIIENNANPNPNPNPNPDQRIRSRPQKEQALNCPRCNSTNTKFCYYNNYSLTQPRYFCKTCRRYWTEGGSLRNVPVGGGSRKNKRPSSSISSPPPPSSTTTASVSLANKKPLIIPDHHHQNPSHHGFPHQGQDLNLAYDHHDHGMSTRLPFLHGLASPASASAPTATPSTSAMELLKTGMAGSRSLSSFMADHHANPAMFPNLGHHEFKPSLSFGLDQYEHHHQSGFNSNGDHHLHHGNNGERLLFPSADHQDDLKQTDTRDDHGDHTDDHDRHQFEQISRGQPGNSAGGYNWNGILGGGNW